MSTRPTTRLGGLQLRRLTVRYPRAARPVLRGADLSVPAGEVRGLVGSSGSGKTTLLLAAAGLVPWLTPAELSGEIAVAGEPVVDLDPGQRAHLLATCLDRPEAQLFLATVRQETAAARRRWGDAFVDRAVDALELGPLLERRITELSSGERQRVALAVALAGCPRPVLLDEPTSHLDGAGERSLNELLGDARRIGSAVAFTEQAGWRLAEAADGWSAVSGGQTGPAPAPVPPEVPAAGHEPGDEVVCSCRGLEVSRGGRTLLEDVEIDLHEGEIVVINGRNGSGKSTLALVLAGLRAPASGTVTAVGRVALMLPEAELQLFASTVGAEVSAPGATREERARILRRHRLDHLAARAPWTLSRGEQQRLVHAAHDLLRPRVMIVDEPGQGLDSDDLAAFLELVRRRSAKGRAYLFMTHRQEITGIAHRRLEIVDGAVTEKTAP